LQNTKPLISKKQVKKLLSVARAWNPKYEMLFLIGFNSGLRVSDVLQIKVRDFILGRKQIFVTEQKTGKKRAIKFSKKIFGKILDYIDYHRLNDNDYMIFRRPYERSSPISRVRAWQIIKKISKEVGWDNIGTHTMRKTFARNHFKDNKDIIKLQQELNHKYPSTTVGYLLDPKEYSKIKVDKKGNPVIK
jgi:integrase